MRNKKNSLIKDTMSLLLSLCIYTTSLNIPAQTSNQKKETQKIIQNLNKFKSSYYIPNSPLNFKEKKEDAYSNMEKKINVALKNGSEKISNILKESNQYLEKYKNNKKTPDYKKILTLKNKLIRFKDLESQMRDGGCLKSLSSTTRSLSHNLLKGSILSLKLPDCFPHNQDLTPKKELTQNKKFKSLIHNLDKTLNCVTRMDIGCKKRKKGIFEYDTDRKRKMIKDILVIKKQLDENVLELINFYLSGKCSSIEKCKILKKLSNIKGGPFEKIAKSVSYYQKNYETFLKKLQKKNKPKNKNNIFKILKSSNSKRSIDLVLSINKDNKSIHNYYDLLKTLGPRQKSSKKINFQKYANIFENGYKDILTGPLRFAAPTAIKKCQPKLLDFLIRHMKVSTYPNMNRKDLSFLPVPNITKENLSCIHKETLSIFNRIGKDKRNKAEEILKNPKTKKDDIDSLLKDLIAFNPLAFGSYLISKGDKQELLTICQTLITLAKEIDEDESGKKRGHFQSYALALFVIAGSIMAVGAGAGPLVFLSLAMFSMGIAHYDYEYYKELREKFQTKVDLETGLLLSGTTTDNHIPNYRANASQIIALEDKENYAKYQQYAAGVGVFFGTVSVTARVPFTIKKLVFPVPYGPSLPKKSFCPTCISSRASDISLFFGQFKTFALPTRRITAGRKFIQMGGQMIEAASENEAVDQTNP